MDNLIIKALIALLSDLQNYIEEVESINGSEEESEILKGRIDRAIKMLEQL